MHRLFGSSKAKPVPNLTEVAANVDERNETVEKKIAKLDAELRQISTQMSKMRDGPGKTALKQKALRIMRQKKVYLHQSEQLQNQSFNISQTDFAVKSLQDTKTTVDAMKASSKAMKTEMKKIKIDEVFVSGLQSIIWFFCTLRCFTALVSASAKAEKYAVKPG
ncbi:unnamed protein product [Echinostoma caproni]|uniref:Charged multivesicular body protein 5 n=1 Tax=Echinostoma caproni TaxID=27848 RepID=A0A183A3P2_9TREM|nr:unnamed protein product [Echinostoma caproni]